MRPKVEHLIGTIKRVFGFHKVRYRGIPKNANRLFVACALSNPFMVRRPLLAGRSVSSASTATENEPDNAVKADPNEALAASVHRPRRPFRSSTMNRVRDVTKSDVP
ncbi:MAG: transposase [Spiribacter salinus]|uniref:Transposase n=1 Tax=Spiribacter salinus TaxID=1335746 RepID=A0A540V833_9GAMM|nr:MAG: transposase [Spiribacter salinus]